MLGAGKTPDDVNAYLATENISADDLNSSPVAAPGQINGATPVASAYNPTPTQRMRDMVINRRAGTAAPNLPSNASPWSRAVDWMQSIGDSSNIAAHGVTAGLSDEVGGLGQGAGAVLATGDPSQFAPAAGRGMDAINANNQRYREQNPILASALEGVGLLTSPLMRLGQTWEAAAPSMAGRAVRSGAVNTATGAGTAAAYNEGSASDRLRAAIYGAAGGGAAGLVLSPALEGAAKGTQTFSQAVAAKKAAAQAPSTAAIKAAASGEYKNVEAAGAVIGPQALQNLSTSVKADLVQFGYHPELQPKVGIVLKELDRVSQGNITAEGVDTLRKIARSVATSADPSERTLGGMIVGKIDDMMENLRPADVVQGNAQQATESLGKARALWKTMRKAELLDGLVDKGELQGMSTNSGGNVQNLIRQKLRTAILENPNNARMFAPDELKAVRQVVRGTWGQNTLRQLGRLAPSSNAWLGIVSTFAAPGVGVAVPMVGAAAKALATRSTKKAIDALSAKVRQGAIQQAPQLGSAPTFPMQVRQQLINQEIRKRLGIAGGSTAGAVGGLVGANY